MSATSPEVFAAALQEKKRRDRRRLYLRWGVTSGTVLLVLFLVWLLLLSPAFRVRDVTVSGTALLTAEAVRDVAQVPVDSPIVTLDTGGVAARVRQLPAVRSVEVSRDLPSTVSIVVTERSAVYQRLESGTFEWVDSDGVVFFTSKEPSDGVLQAVTSGKDARLMSDVATVVSHIPEALRPRVVQVRGEAIDRIILQLDEGALVVWGSSEQSELKADVLVALLPTEAKVYDVSAPSYPTTR
ncbi:cell division protein FtsQ/DivIB [Tessaracoccus sp.]